MLCLLGSLWSVHKYLIKLPLISSSSVFLMILNTPSGVENSNVNCHTSKVASWHVWWRNGLHLSPSLSKIWLKVSKSGKNWQHCRKQKTTNDLHILNVHVKTQLLMYDKRGFFTFEFSTPEGGLRTIRKTELEENNGILKYPLYTLHKGPKRHNICRVLPPNQKPCKNGPPVHMILYMNFKFWRKLKHCRSSLFWT